MNNRAQVSFTSSFIARVLGSKRKTQRMPGNPVALTRRVCTKLKILGLQAELELLARHGRRRVCQGDGVVVSLTTHGVRLDRCHLSIESIARGKERPGRLILWVSAKDLNRPIPRKIRKQMSRGLEVRPAEDGMGPHTKYYHAVSLVAESPGPLVTADDDVLYPRYWLQKLLSCHGRNEHAIFCYRARVMRFESQSRLAPYNSWPYATAENLKEGPLFITGVSGVLYPSLMVDALARRGKGFSAICPSADDIWLTHTAHEAKIPIKLVQPCSIDFPSLKSAQSTGLKHSNVTAHGNDQQLLHTFSQDDLTVLFNTHLTQSDAS